MILLIVSLALFFGFHLLRVLAPGLRAAMIARMGEKPWKVIYSLVSLLTLVLVIYAFDQARRVTGILYTPPVWMAHLTLTLMLIAMICLAAALLPAGYIATKTKHSFVLAIKIWAFSHLLANGETSSVILFAAFLAWGVVVRIALKRRFKAGELTLRPFVSAKYDLYAVVIGLVLWILMIWRLHEWLIGVSPLVLG